MQRERVRGVAGVNAVRLRRQGELGAQDPTADAGAAVRAGWTQGTGVSVVQAFSIGVWNLQKMSERIRIEYFP